MSDPGHGPPIDALDTVCKAYKDCLKCAREEHGNTCIGEFHRYRYGKYNGEIQCKDRPVRVQNTLSGTIIFSKRNRNFWLEIDITVGCQYVVVFFRKTRIVLHLVTYYFLLVYYIRCYF